MGMPIYVDPKDPRSVAKAINELHTMVVDSMGRTTAAERIVHSALDQALDTVAVLGV